MPPPAKKSCQQFREEYKEQWPFLRKSRVGPTYAFCTVCSTDFSVAHSGSFDCKTHVNGAKHKRNAASTSQANIATMFQSVASKKEDNHATKVMRAEAYMARFVAEHNLSLAIADQLPELLRQMCPDSQIARDIRCARTKTTALVKEMSTIVSEDLVQRMKIQPFTVSTDGSNDMDKCKLFPLVIRTLLSSGEHVHSELLSVPTCTGSATGQNIFNLIDGEFQKYQIPWLNCLSLGCDNANVMTGKSKGVFAFCKEKNPEIYLSGCALHLVHVAAEKGADCLPVSANDILTDVYYYFNKSSLRSHNFSQFQELYGTDQKKLLKHVPTRWLSISKCLDRLLDNWDALKEYFKEETKSKDLSKYAKTKCEKILQTLRSRSTKLYMMFLRFTNKVFDEFLTANQSDAPRTVKLQAQSCKLIKQLMLRFVVPSAFAGNKPVCDIDFKSSYNIKRDKDQFIGEECEDFIEARGENGLDSGKVADFYRTVKKYFDTVVSYLMTVLPVKDEFLKHMTVADPAELTSASFSSVRYFAKKYPILLASTTLDVLREEFSNLQVSADMLSQSDDRCDTSWAKIGASKDDTGAQPFHNLAKFMLGLLTVPHSSAHCERIFSSVRKIKTDDRSSLGEDTLEALLIVKHKPGRALDHNFSDSDLSRLKSALSKSLLPKD